MPRLSIIAPMFNEADGLAQFAEQLDAALIALAEVGVPASQVEVIAVDDGSSDTTAERLRELAGRGRLRVVTHGVNRGLGAALWSGFAAARGELVAAVDADCTYALTELAALMALMDAGTGIVTASPYHARGRVDGVPPIRLFLSRSLSRLYNVVLGAGLHTYTAMFRIYRRSAIELVPVHADGFIAVTHLLAYPLLAGVRVREHPTVLGGRRFGTSKLRIARVIRQHLGLLFRLALLRLRGGRGRR